MRLLSFIVVVAIALTACQSNETARTPEPAQESSPAESAASARTRRAEAPEPAVEVEAESDQTAEEPRARTTQVDPARQIPSLVGELDSEGYGLTFIVDGSSPEAFAASLEMIAADTSAAQYQSLDAAIRYRRNFSMSGGSLADFYRSLDGLTAEEIIEQAVRREW